MNVILIAFGLFVLFLLIMFARSRGGKTEGEERLKRIADILSVIREEGHKILVRPTGDIAGLVYDEETYHDENHHNKKRRRFNYYDLDKEDRTDPADAYNDETGGMDDIVPIEKDGGAAITWLSNPDGELQPVLTGPEAQQLKVKHDDYQALASEFENMKEDYRSKDGAYRKAQEKISRIERERDELEDEIEDYSLVFERMMGLTRKLKARIKGSETRIAVLEEELNTLGSRHKELTDEAQEAIEKARERMTEKMKSVSPEDTNVRNGAEEWATKEDMDEIKEMVAEVRSRKGEREEA